MASQSFNPAVPMKREWGTALRALRRLLADGDDTVQVFRIMRALNGDTSHRNYRRLIASRRAGGSLMSGSSWRRGSATAPGSTPSREGSVGAAYRAFLDRTGYSADGLAEVSVAETDIPRNVEHPYAWFGRRERDVHDLWHVLTGYEADEPLGEACLVAFSYAQTGGLGWAFIGVGAALKSLRITGNTAFARAVWEGWRHGRRAAWLHLEDYEALMAEPLDAARARLRIAEPVALPRGAEAARRGGAEGDLALDRHPG